jgi:hypothetical protein
VFKQKNAAILWLRRFFSLDETAGKVDLLFFGGSLVAGAFNSFFAVFAFDTLFAFEAFFVSINRYEIFLSSNPRRLDPCDSIFFRTGERDASRHFYFAGENSGIDFHKTRAVDNNFVRHIERLRSNKNLECTLRNNTGSTGSTRCLFLTCQYDWYRGLNFLLNVDSLEIYVLNVTANSVTSNLTYDRDGVITALYLQRNRSRSTG